MFGVLLSVVAGSAVAVALGVGVGVVLSPAVLQCQGASDRQ